MSRIVNRPIPAPTLDSQRRPLIFRWAGQVIHVAEVLDQFITAGRWWEQEPEQVWWRVKARDGGVFELTHGQDQQGQWRLYRILD